MGKNNKARRAARAREKRRASGQRATHPGGDQGPMFAASDRLEDLFEEAPQRLAGGDTEFVRRAVRQLAEFRPAEVDRHGAGVVLRAVQRVWQHGWQPAELVRHARRQSATLAGVCLAAIAADHAMRSPQSLAPEWARQIGELQLPEQEEPVGTGRWVSRWAEASGLDRSAQLLTIIELVAAILVLPPFDELIPPPGGWTSRANGAKRQADRQPDEGETQLLEKVRSLLAKAESSEFEAEAEAFTAKAHEMITRHAIDLALLDRPSSDRSTETPITRRIPIDDPYADAKSLLLQIVAGANRCRAVFHPFASVSSIVGFSADVAAVEMLFTSLLVQAQSALATAARSAPPGASPRSRSYRSSFLVAYANRIGQRLDEINSHLVAEAESTGRSALPVLHSRQDVVDAVFDERYDNITSSSVRSGSDWSGWASGRAAADAARLNLADIAHNSDEPDAQPKSSSKLPVGSRR